MMAVLGRWKWKDWLIALLGLAVLLLLAQRVFERRAEKRAEREAAGAAVEIFDVLLDRENEAFVDFFFDRDVGQAGEILSRPPATVSPLLAGVWRWRDDNVLRFEPSGGFELASEYTIELILDRLMPEGSTLRGDTEFSVRTDEFILDGVDVQEELAPEGAGSVVFRGTASFNYPVKAEQLAPLIVLRDPEGEGDGTVEVEIERYYGAREQIVFRSGVVNKGRSERVLELVVDGSLTPAGGNVPLGEDFVQAIPLGAKDRLTVRRITSRPGLEESILEIELSSPVDAEIARRYLTVRPDIDYRLSSQRNFLRLRGPFRPGSEYEILLAEGLPAKDEAVLTAAHEVSGVIGHLPPSLDFQSQGMFLSASGYRTVGVDTVNTERFRMKLDRVHLNNLFFLFEYEYGVHSESTYPESRVRHALGDRVVEEVIEVRSERNTATTTPLALDRYLPEDRPGLYRVMVGREGEWSWPQRWLLMTDIGLVTKRGEGGLLVWASSFRDLGPIAGARVTVLSDQNQRIAGGLTDSRGPLDLPGRGSAGRRPPLSRHRRAWRRLQLRAAGSHGHRHHGPGRGWRCAFRHRVQSVSLWRAQPLPAGRGCRRSRRGAGRAPSRRTRDAGIASAPRSARHRGRGETRLDRSRRNLGAQARASRGLPDRQPHSRARGRREGHRPLSVPGGGVHS